MGYCLNKTSPEYKKLLAESGFSDFKLHLKIKDWQAKNNTDAFPTIEQLIPDKVIIPQNDNAGNAIKFKTDLKVEGSIEYAYNVNEGISYYFFKYFTDQPQGLALFVNENNKEHIAKAYQYAKSELEKLNNPNLDYVLKNWDNPEGAKEVSTKSLHNAFLSVFKIEPQDYSDTYDISEESSDRLRNSWSNQENQISSIESASNITRLVIATLPNIVYNNGNPEIVTNKLGLPKLLDFRKTFAVFSNKLSGSTSLEDIEIKLNKMIDDGFNEARTLSNRIFINDNELNDNSYHVLMPFAQAMTKYKNNYIITYMLSDGTIKEFNETAKSTEDSILKEWKNNEEYSRSNNKEYFNADRTYNSTMFKKNFSSIKTLPEVLSFLKVLGIEFNNIGKSNTDQKNTIINRAKKIKDEIIKGYDISIFSNTNEHNSSEDIRKLIEIQTDLSPYDNNENMLYDINGNKIYSNSLYSFFTRTISKINKTTKETFEKLFPHLVLDPYSEHSILKNLLKEGNLRIKESILNGNKIEDYDKQDEFNKLSEGDRLRLSIHKFENGEYALLRPESKNQEHFIKVEGLKKFVDLDNKKQVQELIIGYVTDELETIASLSTDSNAVHGVAEDGIILSLLEMKNKSLRNDLVNAAKKGTHSIKITDNKEEILRHVLEYFDKQGEELYKNCLKYKLISIKNGIISRNTLGRADNDINRFKLFTKKFFINNFIAGIEQTKIFSGNPIFYASPDKFFKRMGGIVGTKDTSFTDKKINDFLDKAATVSTKLAERKKKTIDGVSDGLGNIINRDTGQSVIRIATIEDVIAYTDQFEDTKLDEEEKSAYRKMTEGDGIGWISPDEERRLLIRSSEWKFTMNEHEGLYQWEIQEALGIPDSEKVFYNPFTGEFKELKRNTHFVFNSEKIQGFGSLAGYSFTPSMEKCSVDPLLPSKTEKRAINKIRKAMARTGIGISLNKSGKKIGALKNGHIPYNDDGSVNDNILQYQEVPSENIAIQLKTGNKIKKFVTTGTQMMTHILGDMIELGIDKFPNAVKVIKDFMDNNSKRIEAGMEELKEEFGIEETENGYKITKADKLKELILSEINRRNLPYNTIDGLQRIIRDNTFNIDSIVNRKEVEYILNSLADKYVIRQKRNGRASYQIPSTFYENDGMKRTFVVFDKNGKLVAKGISDITELRKEHPEYTFKVASNFLKFYENKDGKITRMQVGVPSPYGKKIDFDKIDERLKQLIGFRIPTQGLSSIEAIEFIPLPESFGDTILLPTEIVAKAGSDYDIDKMNLYFPNFYTGKDGIPVYINSEDQYKDYKESKRSLFFENLLEKLKDKLELSPYVRQVLNEEISILLRTEGLFADKLLLNLKNRINEEAQLQKGKNKDSLSKLGIALSEILRNNEDITDLGMSFTKFKKLVYENRITEIMGDIITNKANWENLISPISSYELNKEADKNMSEPIMNRFIDIVNINKQIEQHQQFIEGDEAIGRTALASKFNVLAQLHNFFFKKEFIDGDGEIRKSIINLLHNADKDGNILLGKLTNRAGKSISKLLKQWVNTAVDNPTELNLKRLNAGLDTINVWLFLTMAGTPIDVINEFMNQPIIHDYLAIRKQYNSHTVRVTTSREERKNINKKEMINRALNMNNATLSSLKDIEHELTSENYTNNPGQVLGDFLRYEEMAAHIVAAEQALSYDNNSIGKNPMELFLKILNTENVLANTAIGNLENALEFERKITQSKQEPKTLEDNIYSKLGNKTQSENVVIKSWKELKNEKAAIIGSLDKDYNEQIDYIVSTRIPNINKHFGNPFSHNPEGKTEGLIKTNSIKEAVEKYIDWVINSQDERAEWIREQLKSGDLKGKPILYYRDLGESSHATALDYLINKYDWNNTEVQQPVKTEEPKSVINIYAGTNENADLSNFANRPFESTSPLTGTNVKYNTVEGAFQAAKLEYTNLSSEEISKIEGQLMKATGAESKKIGSSIKGLNITEWDKNSSQIMKRLIKESFEQNSESLQRLLATGNATLIHTQDKGKWGKEFPKLLMEVRNELKDEQPIESEPITEPQEEIVSSYKGFISPYYAASKKIQDWLKTFSPMLRNQTIRKELIRFATKVNSMRIGLDEKTKLIDKYRDDFITKALLTYNNNAIANALDRLMMGDNSIAKQIRYVQRIIKDGNEGKTLDTTETGVYNKFKDNLFFNTIIVPSHVAPIDTIKLPRLNLNKFDTNNLIETVENDLKDGFPFFKEVIALHIIQTGNQNNPNSIRSIIPDKFYGEFVDKVFKNLTDEQAEYLVGETNNPDLSMFEIEFKIMNHNDKLLAPKYSKVVGDFVKSARLLPQYKQYMKGDKIDFERLSKEVLAKGINPYSSIPRLYVVTKDGKKEIDLMSIGFPIKDFRNDISVNLYGRKELHRLVDAIMNELKISRVEKNCKNIKS